MEKFSKNDNIKNVVGKNFKSMRQQAGLTKEAMAMAINKSISYILMIERGDANISPQLAKDICDFFEIEISQLYQNKKIKIKPINKLTPLSSFYKENEQNAKFFINRRKEYSTAAFLRETLIPQHALKEYVTVAELVILSKKNFNRKLSSQEVSRELRRSFIKGILERRDKFGNASVYEYRLKKNQKT